MRFIIASFAMLSTLIFAGLTLFIVDMVQLVGEGDNFWSNGMIQLDIVFGVMSIGGWVWLVVAIVQMRKAKRGRAI